MKNEVAVIEKDTKDIVAQANEIVITNQKQYEGANVFLRADKMLQKRIHEAFDTIVDSAYRTWKESGNKRKSYLEPVMEAEKVVKGKIIVYTDEMEEKRREEQRRLELKAKAEEDRKRKELEERAKKWAAKGKEEKAEELQEQAEDVHVEAPVIAPAIEKAKNVSISEHWYADKIDVSLLPVEYLLANVTAINKTGQATKGMAKIPGVVFKCKKILSSRSWEYETN